jgi:hypothetical protein
MPAQPMLVEPSEPTVERVDIGPAVNGGRRRQPKRAALAESDMAPPPTQEVVTQPPPPLKTTTIRERSAGSPTLDELDLEVPSFLRRRRPPMDPD